MERQNNNKKKGAPSNSDVGVRSNSNITIKLYISSMASYNSVQLVWTNERAGEPD